MPYFARRRERWAWLPIDGTARPWPHGSNDSMEPAWGYARVRECFDHWDSVYANRVLWWRRRTRNARRRIKKTPGADGRSAGGSVGNRRGAFSATWFALPDVDSTGDQGPDFAPSSHSPQRRLLGCRSASRGQVLLSSRDRQVQRCYLLGLPASPLPGQHHGIAPARRDHRPCPVSPCPATSQLAGGTCEPIRPRLSTALQPRSQPDRTGLEAYPAAMLTQPILPARSEVTDCVEAQFAQWASGNVTLRRLCAIT